MPDPVSPPIRRKRGCLFYLGLAFAVLLLTGCLLGYLAVRFVKDRISAYTDSAPMTLPQVEMTDAEFQRLDERVTAFGRALDQGLAAPPLVLTERDINALLSRKPEVKGLSDRVHVSLEDNQVKGQVSVPLADFSPIGRDRYLNGEAAFNVSLANGVLIVIAQEVKVKGQPLPEEFMHQLRQENLAKDAYKDPKNAEIIRKLERIEVKDGRVIITARLAK